MLPILQMLLHQRCNVQYAVFGVLRLTSTPGLCLQTLCALFHCEYCAFNNVLKCQHAFLAATQETECLEVNLPVLHVEVETVTSWIERQTGRHHCEGLAATTGHKFRPYHSIIK